MAVIMAFWWKTTVDIVRKRSEGGHSIVGFNRPKSSEPPTHDFTYL